MLPLHQTGYESVVGASIPVATTRFTHFAERQGFEPQDLLQSLVFKTSPFNHSGKSPLQWCEYWRLQSSILIYHQPLELDIVSNGPAYFIDVLSQPTSLRCRMRVWLPTRCPFWIHLLTSNTARLIPPIRHIKFRKVEDGCVDIYFYDWHF
jgi:hypothetical protein